MISSGRKVCRCSDAIEGPSPEPPLNVGMITLTEALPAGTLSSRLHAPKKANDKSDRLYRGMSNISTEKTSRKKFVSASSCTISNMCLTSIGQPRLTLR
jgi:hypothetical protein